ncbi:hypothetical protein [Pseudoclavibacter sp. Z016]|uniref:hypothetical protein n=1 Tax=Pseudoclavibacter sp. Z016 TaxID=2080581 RepID=UPI000CE8A564|nr:hypothetical protein [Pseudoclavibacter sp. Z016]PPF77730.1 hypothetical protein C5B99_02740 [Pseudoclavibacter sp. Z016]
MVFEALTLTKQGKLVETRWTIRTPEGHATWAANDTRLQLLLLSLASRTRTLPPGLRNLPLIQGSAREIDHPSTERKQPEQYDDPLAGLSF